MGNICATNTTVPFGMVSVCEHCPYIIMVATEDVLQQLFRSVSAASESQNKSLQRGNKLKIANIVLLSAAFLPTGMQLAGTVAAAIIPKHSQ